MKIHRDPIDSSVIATIGYDRSAKVLDLEFKEDGKVYRYFDVPASEHEALLKAPSKEMYLNEQFKKAGYRYDVVTST